MSIHEEQQQGVAGSELAAEQGRLEEMQAVLDSAQSKTTDARAGTAAQAAPVPAQKGVKSPHVAPVKTATKTPAAATVNAKEHLIKRQAVVLQLIADFIDQKALPESLFALVGALHHRFRCDRVVVGLYRKNQLRVEAISQQAQVDQKSGEVRLITEAMLEACDQDTMLQFPNSQPQLRILEAHRALIAGRGNAEVCSIPLCHEGELIGALQLERTSKQPWSRLTLQLLQQVAQVIAPLIVLRREGERSLIQLMSDGFYQVLSGLLRPRHLVAKSIVLLIIGLLVGAHNFPVTSWIKAPGELVPTERRVITAPMMGYIEGVEVRAGDQVTAGQTLLRLDTRDLVLERTKWENDISAADTELRSAMASYDRKAMAVAQAQQRQAQAQLDLVDQKLARAHIVAPRDGVVVTGDLSQSLGAPVDRGDVLVEIAPDSGYLVNLLIDESDVPYVRIGQTGRLTLKASPSNSLNFVVDSIHPIAQSSDGSNRFRVEAKFTIEPVGLRPGQTGIGKVDVGEATLLWVWTHRFYEWVRLQLWEWIG